MTNNSHTHMCMHVLQIVIVADSLVSSGVLFVSGLEIKLYSDYRRVMFSFVLTFEIPPSSELHKAVTVKNMCICF